MLFWKMRYFQKLANRVEQSKGAVTLWLPQFITNGRGLELCVSLTFKVMINEVWLG